MRDVPVSRAPAAPHGWRATALARCTFLRHGLSVWLTLALLVHAPTAFALCPNCLGQQKSWDAKSGVLALFLVVPLLVGYASWRLIARWARPSR